MAELAPRSKIILDSDDEEEDESPDEQLRESFGSEILDLLREEDKYHFHDHEYAQPLRNDGDSGLLDTKFGQVEGRTVSKDGNISNDEERTVGENGSRDMLTDDHHERKPSESEKTDSTLSRIIHEAHHALMEPTQEKVLNVARASETHDPLPDSHIYSKKQKNALVDTSLGRRLPNMISDSSSYSVHVDPVPAPGNGTSSIGISERTASKLKRRRTSIDPEDDPQSQRIKRINKLRRRNSETGPGISNLHRNKYVQSQEIPDIWEFPSSGESNDPLHGKAQVLSSSASKVKQVTIDKNGYCHDENVSRKRRRKSTAKDSNCSKSEAAEEVSHDIPLELQTINFEFASDLKSERNLSITKREDASQQLPQPNLQDSSFLSHQNSSTTTDYSHISPLPRPMLAEEIQNEPQRRGYLQSNREVYAAPDLFERLPGESSTLPNTTPDHSMPNPADGGKETYFPNTSASVSNRPISSSPPPKSMAPDQPCGMFPPKHSSLEVRIPTTKAYKAGSPGECSLLSRPRIRRKRRMKTSMGFTTPPRDLSDSENRDSLPNVPSKKDSKLHDKVTDHLDANDLDELAQDDDKVIDSSIPREQYRPRPSRSRARQIEFEYPIDYSMRPEAQVRALRRKSKPSETGNESMEISQSVHKPPHVENVGVEHDSQALQGERVAHKPPTSKGKAMQPLSGLPDQGNINEELAEGGTMGPAPKMTRVIDETDNGEMAAVRDGPIQSEEMRVKGRKRRKANHEADIPAHAPRAAAFVTDAALDRGSKSVQGQCTGTSEASIHQGADQDASTVALSQPDHAGSFERSHTNVVTERVDSYHAGDNHDYDLTTTHVVAIPDEQDDNATNTDQLLDQDADRDRENMGYEAGGSTKAKAPSRPLRAQSKAKEMVGAPARSTSRSRSRNGLAQTHSRSSATDMGAGNPFSSMSSLGNNTNTMTTSHSKPGSANTPPQASLLPEQKTRSESESSILKASETTTTPRLLSEKHLQDRDQNLNSVSTLTDNDLQSAVPSGASSAATPAKSLGQAGQHSPIRSGHVPYRVGLSRRARIEPLLRVVRKQ